MHSSATPEMQVYDSSQIGSPALHELRELWRYRSLLTQLIRRDIVTRYKRSVLGVAWTMLNPLAMMVILTLVFSHLFKSIQGFPAYVLSGLVLWNFFFQVTTQGMNNLLWGGHLLRRIYMPPTVFCLASTGTGLVNMLLSIIPLLGIMLLTGIAIRPSILFLPVSMILLSFFSLGLALLVSRLAVYFYDVSEFYQVGLAAWMYLTPIFYPAEILPEQYRWWMLNLNPVYHQLRLFRLPIYEGSWPGWSDIWPAAVVSVSTLAAGWIYFTHKSREFAYRV